MLQPKQALLDRLGLFSDTEYLTNKLYGIAHDEEIEDMPEEFKYYLMESIENLTGLHDLCTQLAHHLRVETFQKDTESSQITHNTAQHID